MIFNEENNENYNEGRRNEQNFCSTPMESTTPSIKKRQTQGHRRLHVMCPYILVFLMVKTKRVPCYKN